MALSAQGRGVKPLADYPMALHLYATMRLNKLRDVLAKTGERHAIATAVPTHAENNGAVWWFRCGRVEYAHDEDSGTVAMLAPQASVIYGEDGKVRAAVLELAGAPPGLRVLGAAGERVPLPERVELN